MFKKTTLVAVLIAAILVATSTMTSASAQSIQELAERSPQSQRAIIEPIIREIFPAQAASRMIAIAQCESEWKHVEDDGEIFRNRGRTFAGVLQVSTHVHQREIQRLLDVEDRDVLGDVREYILFTRHLFDFAQRQQGDAFAPWPTCARKTAPPTRVKPPHNHAPVMAEAR